MFVTILTMDSDLLYAISRPSNYYKNDLYD